MQSEIFKDKFKQNPLKTTIMRFKYMILNLIRLFNFFILLNKNMPIDMVLNNKLLLPHTLVNLPLTVPPLLYCKELDKNNLYTVIIIDIDAPSSNNPIYSPWLHLLISNIPGIDIINGFTYKSGTLIAEYIQPNPPKNTGIHRYIITICLQTNYINNVLIHERNNFNYNKFVKNNKLKEIARTYFIARK